MLLTCFMENSTKRSRDLFPGVRRPGVSNRSAVNRRTDVQLVPHIQQRSNNLLQVEEGSLYPTLHRLLKAKLARPALPRTCDDAEPVCGRTDRFGARVRRFPGGSSTKSNCRPGAAGLPILFLLTLL
jgi:hypothetical protein